MDRARDPEGLSKRIWKKSDPREMMDADRKRFYLNTQRQSRGLPALEELDKIELRLRLQGRGKNPSPSDLIYRHEEVVLWEGGGEERTRGGP